MTGPKPITGSNLVYYGHPLTAWRDAAMAASAALKADPNDAEARGTMDSASQVLREHAQRIATMNAGANTRDQASALESIAADRSTGRQAFGANAFDAASLGTGPYFAAIGGAVNPHSTARQAYDNYRAGIDQLHNDHSFLSGAGQVVGGAVPGILAGAMELPAVAGRLLPGARTLNQVMAQGGTLAGHELPAVLAGGILGGGEGVVRGALSQGSPTDRLQNVGSMGALGAVTGGAGVGAMNRLRIGNRFWGATRAANKQILSNNADASVLDLASKQASLDANNARARLQGVNADVAEATAPSRITVAQQGAERATMATPRPLQGPFGPMQAKATQSGPMPDIFGRGDPRFMPQENFRTPENASGGVLPPPVRSMPPVMASPEPVAPVVMQGPNEMLPSTAARVQRGATKAQLATRNSNTASYALNHPPTDKTALSVRALFANMSPADRLPAMQQFVQLHAPNGVDPAWAPIFDGLKALP